MWKCTRSPKLARMTACLRAQPDRIRSLLRPLKRKLVEHQLAHGGTGIDTRQAVAIADDEARNRPSDLCHLNRIGDLLARAGRIEPGIALFERVARAYADDGFWAKAIAIYRKILRYDPGRDDIENQLAFLYQRSGLPIGV